MTVVRSAVLAAMIGIVALVAWLAWPTHPAVRNPPAPLAQATTAPAPARLPGRTYLTPPEVHDAIAKGELDRPVTSMLTIDKRLEYGEYRWDDTGVTPGPTWIRVDLRNQILSVFRAGHEIGTSVILYGAESKETPPGLYHILAKAKDHRSSLYDAEMPYTLRLTDDGVSIHASNVRWGAATHGCIGVPLPFAEKMFAAVRVHDDVLVLRHRAAADSPNT